MREGEKHLKAGKNGSDQSEDGRRSRNALRMNVGQAFLEEHDGGGTDRHILWSCWVRRSGECGGWEKHAGTASGVGQPSKRVNLRLGQWTLTRLCTPSSASAARPRRMPRDILVCADGTIQLLTHTANGSRITSGTLLPRSSATLPCWRTWQ